VINCSADAVSVMHEVSVVRTGVANERDNGPLDDWFHTELDFAAPPPR
jgi:hypothetical protein